MKFLVQRADLLQMIARIQGAVPTRPAIPILANVLMEAASDQVILSATDLTVSIRAYCDAKVQQEGAITLPARRLFQLVRELQAPQVEIEAISPEVALVHAGSSHFKIQGMHKSEFPALPDLSQGHELSLQAGQFKEMLMRTAFAAARDDTRPALNGVLMQKSGTLFTFVGTDGKKLAKNAFELPGSSAESGSYIIPLGAVEEMAKLLENGDEKIKLVVMRDKIALETGAVTIISKLLTGQYPDFARVIPAKQPSTLKLHREELIALLRQVALFTSEQSSAVRFSFTEGLLHLSAISGEIGEGKVNMPVNYSGPKLDIAFNPHCFLDVLRHSKDEVVNFSVTEPFSPGLVTDSSQAQFVIMPMRLVEA